MPGARHTVATVDLATGLAIISFVARQRAIRELIGKAGLGSDQALVDEALEWWEKRFSTITLEDKNLAILHDLGAAQFAYLSRWSARGNQQRIDEFAAELAPLPKNTATLERSVAELRERNWPTGERPILGRLEMAVRLLRWLHGADTTLTDFEDSALWYAREGSWVDWARTRIRGGYERGPLAAALATFGSILSGTAAPLARLTKAP